jgi:uncharacterized protein (DUF4415 family)
MNARKRKSERKLGSDFAKVDAHVIQPHEYDELPELTAEAFANGTCRRLGHAVAVEPRLPVNIRLPKSALAAWRSSGPDWQSHMAELLIKCAP